MTGLRIVVSRDDGMRRKSVVGWASDLDTAITCAFRAAQRDRYGPIIRLSQVPCCQSVCRLFSLRIIRAGVVRQLRLDRVAAIPVWIPKQITASGRVSFINEARFWRALIGFLDFKSINEQRWSTLDTGSPDSDGAAIEISWPSDAMAEDSDIATFSAPPVESGWVKNNIRTALSCFQDDYVGEVVSVFVFIRKIF